MRTITCGNNSPFYLFLFLCTFINKVLQGLLALLVIVVPIFNLKKKIKLTYSKDFSWEKNDPNSPDFERIYFSKSPDF
jgi:hypothetical protein